MFDLIQIREGEQNRSMRLVISAGKVPSIEYIKNLEKQYPGLYVIVPESDPVPFTQILSYCNANEISIVGVDSIDGVESSDDPITVFYEQEALDKSVTVYIQEQNFFVAVKDGVKSSMGYDFPHEAFIYAWARGNGYCD